MAHTLNGHDLWKKIAYDKNNRIQPSEISALKEVFDTSFDEWKEVRDDQVKRFINSLYSLPGWNSSRIFGLEKNIAGYLK